MKEEKLEEAKRLYESANADQKYVLESLFPELAGSEDEQIRKALIKFFEDWHKTKSHCWSVSIPKILAWLEKQGEQKQEINNFDVLPGLYKCVHRMFDGTPDGRLLFEVGNVYRCLSKHDRAEFEVSYGHSVYLEDPVVCKHFIPFEKQDETYTKRDVDDAWLKGMCDAKRELEKQAEVVSDKDDIEAEEKGIRKAFNKIWEEKQGKKSQRMISAEAKEAMYAKIAWSEEDEKMINDAISFISHSAFKTIGKGKKNTISWLKSLKDRVQPQNTWKPSDEQMATLYKYAEQNNYDGSILTSLYNDLKKLMEE